MPVTGDKEVAALLRRIGRVPTSAQAKAARGKALRPIVDEAKRLLSAQDSVVTGALQRAIGIGEKDRNTTTAGPLKGRRHTTVAHFVEFGTRPHWQPLRNRHHPGARPKPFLRPAFELHKIQVMEILAAEIRKLLGGWIK